MPVQTRPRTRRPKPVLEVEMEENDHGMAGVIETPRLSKLEFDENDEKIINATLKAFESGSLTPLIKEELRCTIQSRRIAQGKGEMQVEFKTPVRKKEMDDDERCRALKRRQQNREAAQRFRQKQKDTSDYLTAKIRKLERSSNSLMDQMSSLKEEKELLDQMLRDHLSVCSNPQHITSDNGFNNSQTTTTTTASAHTNIPTTNCHSESCSSDNSYAETIHTTPSLSLPSQAQHLFSTSSLDSSMTYQFTPNTAASDASSVFFADHNDSHNNTSINGNYDDNNYDDFDNFENFENYTPPPPQSDDTNTNYNNTPDSDSNPEIQMTPTSHFITLEKLSMPSSTTTTIPTNTSSTSPPLDHTTNNDVILYDGQLDACYEEIIIDFADENAEFLRTDGRTRGDSCSSVDTVSSMYSAPTTGGADLTPISETPTDVVVPQFHNHNTTLDGSISINVLSAYSGIHNIIDAANFNHISCGKTVSINDDFLLLDAEGI